MLRQGARKKGGTVLIVHVRLQAIVASLVMLPNSLFRRGLLWHRRRGLLWLSRIALGSGTLLAVLASARLLRRYGRLNFIEFLGESGLQEALFAELAAGAGVRAYGVPSHAGGLPGQILANAGAAKNGRMREFGRLGVG
jgi:hypothetical protein